MTNGMPGLGTRCGGLPAPLLTTEPVLTEAFFLLRREGCDADKVFALAEDGVIKIGLCFE